MLYCMHACSYMLAIYRPPFCIHAWAHIECLSCADITIPRSVNISLNMEWLSSIACMYRHCRCFMYRHKEPVGNELGIVIYLPLQLMSTAVHYINCQKPALSCTAGIQGTYILLHGCDVYSIMLPCISCTCSMQVG